tara:strand:+ start:1537 stop:1782 length:246 start_codon:yes stop_codon:yes gene_type:complete
MTPLAHRIILAILTLIVIYAVAIQEYKPDPIDECYRITWGDLDRKRELGIDHMNAKEVYEYCFFTTVQKTAVTYNKAEAYD